MPRSFLVLLAMTTGLLGLVSVSVTAGTPFLTILAGALALVCVAVLVWVVSLDARRERETARTARELRKRL